MTRNSLLTDTINVLMQLINVIQKITYDDYVEKLSILSNSSIGEHTRHIIELFQKLLLEYNSGEIDYDNRQRNLELQENVDFAIESLANIICNLNVDNKILHLKTVHFSLGTIETNYFRELLYNLEHCIHHQAIIKIALLTQGNTDIDQDFGVAKSTLKFREACVQ